jgi:predicted nucleotidyltransferase component of viral defense system
MESKYMTAEIKVLLDKIETHSIFKKYPFYFIGGTALSVYLDHRISYDIDITSTEPLPISALKSFVFGLKGDYIVESAKASAFRINSGENLEHYYMKFMVDGVKLEFSYFSDDLRQGILENSLSKAYTEGGTLQILSLEDIITLKAIALFNREKSRDLFDMAILLEHEHISIEELERIYSFYQKKDKILWEYIKSFDTKKDDDADSSLDFLPHQKHYKTFARLSQNKRFEKSKELFLNQYNEKQKKKLEMKKREVLKYSLKCNK